MTPAALLIGLAGLSRREAGEYLGVRPDTVKSWFRSRPKMASPGVVRELVDLIERQEAEARELLALMNDAMAATKPPDEIEVFYPSGDAAARDLGWPSVGAWQAMAARVIARSPIPVRLSPTGSMLQ